MQTEEPIIQSEQDVTRWVERWAQQNTLPTVKRNDGSYVDNELNVVWKALMDFNTPKLNKAAQSKTNKVDDHLTVNSFISLLEQHPSYTIELYSPVAEENDEGDIILVFKKAPKGTSCSFLELVQTMMYLKGASFRTPEYHRLTVKGSTPLYVEQRNYNYHGGDRENVVTHKPLRRSMVMPYDDGWE